MIANTSEPPVILAVLAGGIFDRARIYLHHCRCGRVVAMAQGREMKITIIAMMCHSLAGINAPVCREEVVMKQDMPMQACVFSQPAIAEWKERSIYRGSSWIVQRIKCAPGDYVLRDAT